MTVQEIINRIKTRVDDDDISTDFLLDAVNSVYKRVLNSHDVLWTFLEGKTTFQTAEGDNEYLKSTIAADMRAVYDMYTANNKVYPVAQRDFDEYIPDPTSTGNITHYMEWGDTIKVYPIPSSVETVNVRYHKNATTDLELTDTPIIPEEFHEILILGGMMLFYEQDEDFDRLDRKTSEYEVMLTRMKRWNESQVDMQYTLGARSYANQFQPNDYQSSHR